MSRKDHALVLYLILVVLLTGWEAQAQDDLPDPDAPGLDAATRIEVLQERIRQEQSQLITLTARFTQRKESKLLLEPEISTGRFWYQAPDSVRWEFETPVSTLIVLRGETMLTWYRDLGRAEIVHAGKQAEKMLQFLGASPSLESLKKYFDLRIGFPDDPTAPFSIRLDPRFARVEKRIAEMALRLDRELYVPVFVHYVEGGGDETEITFEELRVNEEISTDLFELTLPEEVEVHEIKAPKS